MTEHTPGPYTVREGTDTLHITIEQAATGKVIAELQVALLDTERSRNGERTFDYPENAGVIATAHLMAEAPTLRQQNKELLEALGEIAGVASLDTPITLVATVKRLSHIQNEARTAIEKGGTNA